MRILQERLAPPSVTVTTLPDGWAATRSRQLGLASTITIRGSKDEWLKGTDREALLVEAMSGSTTFSRCPSREAHRRAADSASMLPR